METMIIVKKDITLIKSFFYIKKTFLRFILITNNLLNNTQILLFLN